MSGAAAQANAAVETQDSFLAALAYLTAFFGHARSPEALAAGFAVHKGGMTPKIFCTAANRAGFRARVMRRDLAAIPDDVLPVTLTLKDKTALLLLHKDAQGVLQVMDPLTREEKSVKAADLKSSYSGYAIYARPDYMDDDAKGIAPEQHWFHATLNDNWWIYRRVLLASLFVNIFALTSPVFIMNFYNRVLPNDAVETGWVLAIGATGVFIFDFIIKSLRGYFIDVAGRRADVIMGQRLFDQVLDMRLGQRRESIGAFANSLREFDSLREFFNSATATACVDFPFSLLFIAVIWYIGGPQMALLLVGLYLAVVAMGYLMQIPVRRKVHQAMHTSEKKHGLLVETISGIETIRGISGEGHLRALYGEMMGKSAEAGQASRHYSGISVHFSGFIQQFSGVLIVLLGMYLVKDREMTAGALIACVLLSSRAIAPCGALAALVNKIHQARSAYRTLDAIMRIPVERPRDKTFLHRPDLKGGMTFRNVSFSYPFTHVPVLQGVNLTIQPGEKVGIVGRIGSGKSSLTKMMVNFYEPSDGAILVDGTDMRQIDPADLRRTIAYMGQDTALFRGTVRENIVMGRPHASDADILKVSELTGAHDFLRRHPQGYDAPVSERGEGLSGGQRQAVALARTLLMDAPVLILDEPTNAMDGGSEERVLRGLETHLQDKTLVLVTHKPALLRLVTRLIVMDGGRVVADGPRDQVWQALAEGKVAATKG